MLTLVMMIMVIIIILDSRYSISWWGFSMPKPCKCFDQGLGPLSSGAR